MRGGLLHNAGAIACGPIIKNDFRVHARVCVCELRMDGTHSHAHHLHHILAFCARAHTFIVSLSFSHGRGMPRQLAGDLI